MSVSRNKERSAYWSFTYNLEKDAPLESADFEKTELEKVLRTLSWVDDAGFQLEKGSISGRYHLQGWIKLNKRQYKSYLLNGFLNQGKYANCMHFERARNITALESYCMKDDSTKISDYWCKSEEAELKEQREKEEKQRAIMKELDKDWNEFMDKRKVWVDKECEKNGFFNHLCYCSEESGDEDERVPYIESIENSCKCHLNPNLKGVFTQYWNRDDIC